MTAQEAITKAYDAVAGGFGKTEVQAEGCKVTAYRVGTILIQIDVTNKPVKESE